jgi:RimJ/RimL family protein N-acetyltransferase
VKDTERGIGSVYLQKIDMENKTAEFGIFIGEDDENGKGFGSEAL